MIVMALLLSAAAPAATSARVEADAASVERAAAALAPHLEGNGLDGKPGTERLAEAQWQAVQYWVAHWLDIHPHAGPDELAKASARFGDAWTVSAVALARGDILISASRYQVGNVFILGRNGDGYRLRWSAAMRQPHLDPVADRALALWRPMVQNLLCAGHCRLPGAARIGRLPSTADGAARFWIEAGYAQEMGATMGQQLSLWSWQAGHARPLLVHDFAVMADQSGPVLRHSTLYVPSKGHWTSLYACGSCYGRVTDLRIAIEPRRVRQRSPVSRTPELDLVDRVYARVLARQQVGALASPSALRVIRAQLADRLAETDPQLSKSAGMMMGWKRWRAHGAYRACLTVEGVGTTAFAFDAGMTRITSAQALAPGTCQGAGTRM